MLTTRDVFLGILIPYLSGTIFFVLLMNLLRKKNFHSNGERKQETNWRNLNEDQLGKQIEYHNTATYKTLDLYIKCLLALLGGIAVISTNLFTNKERYASQINQILLTTAGYFIGFLTLIFCVLIFVHQKSKIERWRKGFAWYSPIVWNECWFTSTAITILVFVCFIIIPKLDIALKALEQTVLTK